MVLGPSTSRNPLTTPTAPRDVVEAFLDALADSDLERASELIAENIDYVNVGLPVIRGRERVLRALALMDRPSASFEVYVHAISVNGPTVLTERTDVLSFGRFRSQFWVTGRFDVVDGRITLWRDSFDYLDVLRASVRGLAAMAVPALRPAAPAETDAPGRPKRH
ncbi:limonene-1,2-epoxide hydrolase family protein [uncultured Jatrophihabitans sp.]|uniref:limonene-1,2-epoxide hydrolase family protein n=1 Tax=uncultured Jatrophihabitans sp. TaxID=1610747 RepID=UPI0035CB34F0